MKTRTGVYARSRKQLHVGLIVLNYINKWIFFTASLHIFMTEQSSWQTRCLRTYYFKETLMRKAVVFNFRHAYRYSKVFSELLFLDF